jgi:hypothetical protein
VNERVPIRKSLEIARGGLETSVEEPELTLLEITT